MKKNKQKIKKKTKSWDKKLKEDIEIEKRTEEADQRIKQGKGIKMDCDIFVKELEK